MKRAVGVVVAALLVLGLAGCGDQYTEVCTDPAGNRVPEWHCTSPGTPYVWLWYPVHSVIPGYGYPVPVGGYRTVPRYGRTSQARPPAGGGVAVPPRQKVRPAQQQAPKQPQRQTYRQYPQAPKQPAMPRSQGRYR